MFEMKSRRSRTMVALAAVLTLAAGAAEARPGGGKSVGSRGSRTYEAPERTPTAPQARPIERSTTQAAPAQAQRPGAQAAQPATGSRFGGFGGGLMAGLLGAGLLGMLFGGGLFGGLGGLASMLGLLIQVALIAGLAYLAIRFFRRRQEQPAMAGAYARQAGPSPYGATGGHGLGMAAGAAQAARPADRSRRPDEIGIGPSDYAEFERGLVEVQTAFGREDVGALRTLATPEMAGYFEEELRANAAQGLVNRLGDVRLLQGDLAEAWREDGADYATVAMRYQLSDATFDRATNRLVGGDDRAPTEAREIWTFRRERGGRWLLSAIQQAD